MTDDAADTPPPEEASLDGAAKAVDAGMACLTRMDLDGALAHFAAVEGAHRFSVDPAARVQWARALNGLGFIDLIDAKNSRAAADDLTDEVEKTVRWGLKQALARFDQALAVQADARLRSYVEGNKAYALALLGREDEARALFRRLFQAVGREAYDGQIGDLKRCPIPEDQAVARIIDDAWGDAAG